MGLHLTGKGSILDAIGGAVKTGANAVVAGAKDVGDIGSLGLANLTGNAQAAQSARSAISSNDSNLSGESLPQNVGGLATDVATPVVKPIISTIEQTDQQIAGSPAGQAIKLASATISGNSDAQTNAQKGLRRSLPSSNAPGPLTPKGRSAVLNLTMGAGEGEPVEGSVPEATKLEVPKVSAPENVKPVTEPTQPAPKPVQNADADRAAQNVLKAGGDMEQAASIHQSITGDTRENSQVAAQRIANQSGMSGTGNPLTDQVDLPIIQPGDTKGAIFNGQLVERNVGDVASVATDAINKLDTHDQNLLDALRTTDAPTLSKTAHSPERFIDAAQKIQSANDYTHALGQHLGQDISYRQQYAAPLLFDRSTPEAEEAYQSYAAKLATDPAYAQQRKYASYEDAAEQTGGLLRPRNETFKQDFLEDMNKRQNDLQQLALAKGLSEAHPGKIAVGELRNGEEGTYKQLQIPGGIKLSAPSDIADEINHRANFQRPPGLTGVPARIYDNVNGFYKSLKLSIGFFHDLNTMSAYLGKQLFSSHILEGRQLTPLISKVSPKYYENLKQSWRDSGALEKMHTSGLTLDNQSPEVTGEGKRVTITSGKYNPIRALHDSLFQREIPTMKGVIFDQETRGMDIHNPEDRAQMQVLARRLNEGFGGLNRATDGLTPRQAQWAGRFLLAPDYEEGQIRTLMAAVSKGGADGRLARQIMFGRAALFAVPAVVAAGMSGQLKTPEQWVKFIANQLINPNVPTGFKSPGGNPKIAEFPSNPATKAVRIVSPFFQKNNPDKLSGLQHEAVGNEASGISALNQLFTNKDYYGNPIIVHNKNGKVDFSKTALQLGAAQGPIPTTHVERVAGGSETPLEAAVNVAGLRTATNPNAPAIQILNNRELVREGLSADDQGALDAIHPSWAPNSTKDQQAAVYNNPNYEIQKWTTLADNRNVFNALKAQNDFAMQHGQPGNPLFALNTHDQAVIIRYEQLKASDPGSDANDTAAVIYAQNKPLITKFENDTAAYQTAQAKLFRASGGLKGDNSPQITPGGVPYPAISQSQQDLATQYTAIADSKTRAQFLTDHPEVAQMFTAIANYENAKRAKLGEPLLKDYPQAPAGLESWIGQYTAASKAQRTSLRNANPDLYKQMSNYMAQVDEYNLARTAGQAKFQGTSLSQANLKEIYNLGQYDIVAPPAGATGVGDTYSVNPEAAYTQRTATGSASKAESIIAKLEKDLTYHAIKETVKYTGKIPKPQKARRPVKLRSISKVSIKSSAPSSSSGKVRLKSAATV